MFDLLNHIHIWQVSLQLGCSDTCQIWKWYIAAKYYFFNSEKWENFMNGKNKFSPDTPNSELLWELFKAQWCFVKPLLLIPIQCIEHVKSDLCYFFIMPSIVHMSMALVVCLCNVSLVSRHALLILLKEVRRLLGWLSTCSPCHAMCCMWYLW